MWTVAVVRPRCVAVGAEYLKPRWEAMSDDPLSDHLSTEFLPVDMPRAFQVLDLQELNVCLSTTGAPWWVTAVVLQHHHPSLALLLFAILPMTWAAVGQNRASLRSVKLRQVLVLPASRAMFSGHARALLPDSLELVESALRQGNTVSLRKQRTFHLSDNSRFYIKPILSPALGGPGLGPRYIIKNILKQRLSAALFRAP